MPLDPHSFSEPVAAILAQFPSIELPLTKADLRRHSRLAWFAAQPAASLFPEAREPECALSGLLLLLGGWDESHEASQDIDRPAGSYWHGIAHRMEPDFWNSGYWFRRLRGHPIYAELREGAATLADGMPDAQWRPAKTWDPSAFIQLCERSLHDKTGPGYKLACAVQSLEWELLFSWCAEPLRS